MRETGAEKWGVSLCFADAARIRLSPVETDIRALNNVVAGQPWISPPVTRGARVSQRMGPDQRSINRNRVLPEVHHPGGVRGRVLKEFQKLMALPDERALKLWHNDSPDRTRPASWWILSTVGFGARRARVVAAAAWGSVGWLRLAYVRRSSPSRYMRPGAR